MHDLRYSARSLSRSPGFLAVAVLTLALGIGANSAMFSVVNAMLLRPLPYPNRDRLVEIWATNLAKGWTTVPVSPLDFLDWREQNQSFERLIAARFWFYNLTGEGNPEQLHGMRVSPGFFEMLGVQPALGRDFRPEEEQTGRDHVVILTHGLWQRRFAADPAVIGKTISIDAEPFTVVGVMPEDFWFYPILGKDVELWMPFALERSALKRDARSIMVRGLLKPDVSIEQARGEFATIARRLEQQYPKENTGWGVRVDPGIISKEDVRPKVLLLFAAVGFVLLIACANVANLTLARAVRRRPETALRVALGARPWRIVRQLLVESALLGAAGCVAGLLLGAGLLRAFERGSSFPLRQFLNGGPETLQLNPTVFAFSLVVALAVSVLLGLLPAWQACRTRFGEALKIGGQRSTGAAQGRRLRDALVVSQVALAVMLSIGAGLMVRSLWSLEQVDRGLNMENVLTLQISPPEKKYDSPGKIASFYQRIFEEMKTLPGALSTSGSSFLPLGEIGVGWPFTIEGRPAISPEQRPNALYYVVEPGFFQTMQIALVHGRYLTAADGSEAPPVAVIDEKLAERYWPAANPLGERFQFDPLDQESPWHANLRSDWITVVGVVGTIRGDGLWDNGAPVLYLPYQQDPARIMHLMVRTSRDPLGLANAAQRKVWNVDPDQPVTFVRPMKEVPAWALSQRRLTMQLLGALAALATLLSAAGIYGVISYAVSQRTQEVGIRIALGAKPSRVARAVVAEGLKVVLVGLALGVTGAVAVTRYLASQLYGVTPTDPRTFVAACLILLLVAVLACYAPARRASRVDPMTALRCE